LRGSSGMRTWGGSGSSRRWPSTTADRGEPTRQSRSRGQTSRDREVTQRLVLDHQTLLGEHGAKERERDAALVLGYPRLAGTGPIAEGPDRLVNEHVPPGGQHSSQFANLGRNLRDVVQHAHAEHQVERRVGELEGRVRLVST
jgi:hypothetical protein